MSDEIIVSEYQDYFDFACRKVSIKMSEKTTASELAALYYNSLDDGVAPLNESERNILEELDDIRVLTEREIKKAFENGFKAGYEEGVAASINAMKMIKQSYTR